jgi:hypothetical protein
VIAEVHELVREVARQNGEEVGRAREEDGRHLSGAAADGQDRPREDPGPRLRHHHLDHGLELGGPERERGLPHVVGDRAQRLLRGHDDHRQRQHRHGERRPDERVLAERLVAAEEGRVDAGAEELHEEAQAEEAEHDRRHAREVRHGDAHAACEERARIGVLVQVDGRGHTHRHHGDGHQDDERDGAEDGGEDPAGRHAVGGRLGDELEREARSSVLHDVPDDDAEDEHHESGGAAGGEGQRGVTDAMAQGSCQPGRRRQSSGWRAHDVLPSRRFIQRMA